MAIYAADLDKRFDRHKKISILFNKLGRNKLQISGMFPQWFKSPQAELAKYDREKLKEMLIEKELKRQGKGTFVFFYLIYFTDFF